MQRDPAKTGERTFRLLEPFSRYFPTQKPLNFADFGWIQGLTSFFCVVDFQDGTLC